MADAQTSRYAILRDRESWDAVRLTGLRAEADGALTLARTVEGETSSVMVEAANATGDAGQSAVSAAAPFFISSGLLEVSPAPLDAGEQGEWARVTIEAETPAGTSVELEVFAHDEPDAAPSETDWLKLPTLDALVPSANARGEDQSRGLRYLWIRVRLTSADGSASPRLSQVSAETTGETYLEYLPAFYRRDETTRHLLGSWLSLFQSEFGDLELKLKEMSRRFDPAVAPEEFLPWLAGWMAFEPPPGRSAQELRRLLPRINEIYNRRGTLGGLGHLIELYTGVRPRISEAFTERKIWQLDRSSLLGEDTFLPSASPNGIVLPERTAAFPVGEILVGESSPLTEEEYGWPLFSETAHRFTVYLPAAEVPDAAQRNAIRQIIEAEMPAHAEYHLCFFEDEPEEENIASGATGGGPHAASRQTLEAASEQPTGTSMLVVEAVEFRDVNNQLVGLLEDPRQSPQFDVSQQIVSLVVRFNDEIDADTLTAGGSGMEQAAVGFLVQASWSRRADKSCPGSILLDGETPRTVRFNIATPSGYFRTGRYTVTLYGDEDAPISRPAIKSADGRRLNGAAWQTTATPEGAAQGGNFVFNFQITA